MSADVFDTNSHFPICCLIGHDEWWKSWRRCDKWQHLGSTAWPIDSPSLLPLQPSWLLYPPYTHTHTSTHTHAHIHTHTHTLVYSARRETNTHVHAAMCSVNTHTYTQNMQHMHIWRYAERGKVMRGGKKKRQRKSNKRLEEGWREHNRTVFSYLWFNEAMRRLAQMVIYTQRMKYTPPKNLKEIQTYRRLN